MKKKTQRRIINKTTKAIAGLGAIKKTKSFTSELTGKTIHYSPVLWQLRAIMDKYVSQLGYTGFSYETDDNGKITKIAIIGKPVSFMPRHKIPFKLSFKWESC